MKIELRKVTVRELTAGYMDNEEGGVRGLGGKLDIRPPYQREFIYDDKKRDAVIDTVRKGFPLNVMYWARREDDAEVPYEVMDGQQRTISVCQYVNGDFPFFFRFFDNLTKEEQDEILDYELQVYVCSGSDKEKLDWFRTINIAGERLTDQELRNAVFAGPWLADAKRHFSKTGCAAYGLGSNFVNGSPIRQDYLETALRWIAASLTKDGHTESIEGYMAKHQHDQNANALWMYFRAVIEWVQLTFPKYRKEMKGLDWGGLYDRFHEARLDTDVLETEIADLMQDDDVTSKKGIYPYVLTRDERYLNIRQFTPKMKREAYERQHGVCPRCGDGHHYELDEMEADHITPWSEGGPTTADNCQMLCRRHNREKGAN